MLSQADLAARAGISEGTVRSIEATRREGYQLATLRGLAAALGWSAGSIDDVLDGGEPSVIEASEPTEPADLHAEVERLRGEVAELRSIVESLSDPN